MTEREWKLVFLSGFLGAWLIGSMVSIWIILNRHREVMAEVTELRTKVYQMHTEQYNKKTLTKTKE